MVEYIIFEQEKTADTPKEDATSQTSPNNPGSLRQDALQDPTLDIFAYISTSRYLLDKASQSTLQNIRETAL